MNKLSVERWKCGVLHLQKRVTKVLYFLPIQHHEIGSYANLTFFIDSKFHYLPLYYILDVGGGQIYLPTYPYTHTLLH